MSLNKKSYYQGGGGVNEPTPGKKKYPVDKAILVQPRFKEPFYSNYDLYETEGVNGKPKSGPGAGWHHMHNYKSIKEFRDAKRKHLEDKYKADDFWIEDSESNRKQRIKKMKIRAKLLSKIIKNAIDFPDDDQITDPTTWNSGAYSDAAQIGGRLDYYLPENDLEDKKPEELNFGRDYADDHPNINELLNRYLSPKEPALYGLPDGIEPKEDLDAPSDEQPQYGTTDSGNTSYNEMWI
jgi:hypothetical protein